MALNGTALPDFPWDTLAPLREQASMVDGGMVDLTIGTPADAVPAHIQNAIAAAANSHGYPPSLGSARLHEAIRSWLASQGVSADVGVIPTLGSKEMVALLVASLGIGTGAKVGFPHIAYPTYEVGALLAGATPVPLDTASDPATWPRDLALLWLNSPSNPTGAVLSLAQLQAIRAWASETGTVIASDECYRTLVWDVDEAPSILDKRVCGDDPSGLLMLYSLSKESNMAGVRAAFIAGDPALIGPLGELRKHAGFMLPGPSQAAMIEGLTDRSHVAEQVEIYRRRREELSAAVTKAGLRLDPSSVAGLYLWVSDPDCPDGMDLAWKLARVGILVAPGSFYGEDGRPFVRMSLTASDAVITQAVRQLSLLG